jgi:hypothetical protein
VAEHGPSEAAVEAAAKGMVDAARVNLPGITAWEEMAEGPKQANRAEARGALAAAHNPALGLNRSVCLRDVVKMIRGNGGRGLTAADAFWWNAAEQIERAFTESSSPDREGAE